MMTVLAAFCIREDLAGVTSFVRCLALKESCYPLLLNLFHSSAVNLMKLRRLWTSVCFNMFCSYIQKVQGHFILIVDGLKKAKEGGKMPAVKSLHQESQNNTKAEYIMGHHFECISLLIGATGQFFAVPMVGQIVEGVLFSPDDENKTIIDKVIELVYLTVGDRKIILVADAYYAVKKLMVALKEKGNHLISRMRTNAVAWEPATKEDSAKKKKNKQGRPKVYGAKVVLRKLFDNLDEFISAPSPVYGDKGVEIRYRVRNLLLRPFAIEVRIVLAVHPARGKIILVCTDRSVDALTIIKIYGYRFKIEVSFKQAVWTLGTYACHFWMAAMDKIKRGSGDQRVYEKDQNYQEQVCRKLKAHHVYVQLGLIAQGLLMYLSVIAKDLVWRSFGSWFRTMKTQRCPSELVVVHALRSTFWTFLWNLPKHHIWKKFIKQRIDSDRLAVSKIAA